MSDNPYDPNDPSTTPPASDQQEPTAPIPQYGSDNSAYGSTPQYPTSDNSGQPRYGSYENSGPIPPVTPPQMPMGGQVPPGGQFPPPSGQVPPGAPVPPPGYGYRDNFAKGDTNVFFRAIFNLNFDRYATPAIVKIVYIILMVISLVAGVFGIISGFVVMFSGRGSLAGAAVFAGLVQVVLSIVLPVVVLAVYRMMLEFYIATIRTSENVQKLVDKFGA